ncbi:MAG: cupredoxin domain-containing protein [Polyangiales bacterium]
MIRSLLLALALVSLPLSACSSGGSSPPAAAAPDGTPRVAIRVDSQGYHPAEVEVRAGAPVVLVFTRTSDEGCGHQLAIPALGIRRDLPLDQPVEVMIRPERGTLRFTCGMDMLQGTIVVR